MPLETNIKANGLAIHDIRSIGIDDLQTFTPSTDGFMIVIDLSIGRENDEGVDDFRFTLVDQKGFIKYILETDDAFSKNGFATINDYKLMIIDNYSYPKLEMGLCKILKSIDTHDSWLYIASQLNQYFYWEYESECRDKLKNKTTADRRNQP